MSKVTEPTAIFFHKDIVEIGKDRIDQLKQLAGQAPFRRARFCLHRNAADSVQEMIIAFCRDSYVRPHRHLDKSESFHVIEGELLVVIFDKDGKVIQKIKMAPYGMNQTFFYRLSSDSWHTVIPLSEFVVIHEVTNGPFVKDNSNLAKWAPDGNDPEGIRGFMLKIKDSSN